MTTRTITVDVEVDLSDFDDDQIIEEAESRDIRLQGIDQDDLRRWADMLRVGKDAEVLTELRAALGNHFGLAVI